MQSTALRGQLGALSALLENGAGSSRSSRSLCASSFDCTAIVEISLWLMYD